MRVAAENGVGAGFWQCPAAAAQFPHQKQLPAKVKINNVFANIRTEKLRLFV